MVEELYPEPHESTKTPMLRRQTTLLEEFREQYLDKGYEKAYQAATEAINKNFFKPEAFFIGVLNYTTTILMFDHLCGYYWMFHTVKGIVGFSTLLQKRVRTKTQYYFFDFCWVFSFSVIGYALYSFVMCLLGNGGIWTPELIAILTGFSTGTLVWAAVSLNNALVFHRLDHIASLFIHFSPLVLAYSIRWSTETRIAFPELFSNTKIQTIPFKTYYDLLLSVYFTWAIFYLMWMLIWGLDYPKQGYGTIWECNRLAFVKLLERTPFHSHKESYQFMAYMFLHASSNFATLALSYVCYVNHYFHIAFGAIALLRVIWNGASFYHYVLGKAILKKMQKTKDSGLDSQKDILDNLKKLM